MLHGRRGTGAGLSSIGGAEMTDSQTNLCAFVAVLAAIVILSLWGKADAAILTGLVGVVGSFRPRVMPPTDTHNGDTP